MLRDAGTRPAKVWGAIVSHDESDVRHLEPMVLTFTNHVYRWAMACYAAVLSLRVREYPHSGVCLSMLMK